MIWSSAFWRGAAERAVKTFAQSLVAVIGVGAVGVYLDVTSGDGVSPFF